METIKVGVREFRADLATYLSAKSPVAVKRHGQTIGYFVPVSNKTAAEVSQLREAGTALEQALKAHQVAEDDLVEEFKVSRRNARGGRGQGEHNPK